MALIPVEVKQALKLLRSMDISLGSIADSQKKIAAALEEMINKNNEEENKNDGI